MASSKVTASDDGRVSITVPAKYAEDFRAAIVEEITFQVESIKDHRQKAEEHAKWDDAHARIERADMGSDMRLLAEDATLLWHVGAEGTSDIEVEASNEAEASALAHVFELMGRRIVAPRLSTELGYGPHDERAAVEIRAQMERLSWAVDRAAEYHGIAVEGREQERGRS